MRLEDLLGKAVEALTGSSRSEQDGNVQPASQDPWGDPADQGQTVGQFPGGVQPASQDPYGDPADMYNGQQVADSSQDPYGDPADEEEQAVQPRRNWPF
jgi:hypothetical protein